MRFTLRKWILTIFKLLESIVIRLVWFGLDGFYGISTVVSYLMLNPLYTYVLDICGLVWFGLVGFYGISTIVGYLKPNSLYTYIY